MKGIGGGNFLILGENTECVLRAAEIAVKKMNKLKNIILPFPGGIVRSGSKVGSKDGAIEGSNVGSAVGIGVGIFAF